MVLVSACGIGTRASCPTGPAEPHLAGPLGSLCTCSVLPRTQGKASAGFPKCAAGRSPAELAGSFLVSSPPLYPALHSSVESPPSTPSLGLQSSQYSLSDRHPSCVVHGRDPASYVLLQPLLIFLEHSHHVMHPCSNSSESMNE